MHYFQELHHKQLGWYICELHSILHLYGQQLSGHQYTCDHGYNCRIQDDKYNISHGIDLWHLAAALHSAMAVRYGCRG